MEVIQEINQVAAPSRSEVQIWGIEVPAVTDQLDRLHAMLREEEQEKAARFHHASDRDASIAARGALRLLIAHFTQREPVELIFRYTENGKPYLISPHGNLSFNISHSGDWVLLAIGRERHIGVDIERIRRSVDVLTIAARWFTAGEASLIEKAEDPHDLFFRLWARKEAFIKACGTGLFRELSSFTVPLVDGRHGGWYFRGLEAGSHYSAAMVTNRPLERCPCYDFSALRW